MEIVAAEDGVRISAGRRVPPKGSVASSPRGSPGYQTTIPPPKIPPRSYGPRDPPSHNAASRGGGVSGDVYSTHPAFEDDRRRDTMRELERPHWKRSVAVQLGMFAAIMLVWWFPIINPVKLLVVLFHEMSHVAAAYATGGIVFGMAIDPGGAGVTMGMGGSQPVILSSGYLGSLLIGFFLYAAVALWNPNEVWGGLCLFCGLSLALRWLNEFTQIFGLGAMILMGAALVILRPETKKFWLRIVATTTCMYPLLDVAGEAFGRAKEGFHVRGQLIGSDVGQIARLTSLPPVIIAVFWILMGLGLLLFLIDWSARKDAAVVVKRRLIRKPKYQKPGFRDPLYDPNNPESAPEYTIR